MKLIFRMTLVGSRLKDAVDTVIDPVDQRRHSGGVENRLLAKPALT